MPAKKNILVALGGVVMAASVVSSTIGWLLFGEALRAANISPWYALVAGAALGACFVAWGLLKENRRLAGQIDDQHAPLREKIAQLRGIAKSVEHFFEGRECERNWPECARMLGHHAIDARNHGLYDWPEFSDERLAVPVGMSAEEAEKRALSVFNNLNSMMRRRRKESGGPPPWEEAAPNFQKWLLEDIATEIAAVEEEMGI